MPGMEAEAPGEALRWPKGVDGFFGIVLVVDWAERHQNST